MIGICDDLRKAVLQAAIQGKLTEQLASDGDAETLYSEIQAEKKRLIKEGKIKKEKELESIDLDDVPFDIPDNWKWVRLGEIFAHNTGKALNQRNEEGNLMSYITTSNLYWNGFVLENLRSMKFTESEIDKCTVKKGDLLVCEGGDIGRSAIWPYDYEMRIQNHIHKLRAYKDICTKFYWYVLFLYKMAELIGGKGIGIQGLSSNALHMLFIPLPPLAEQHRIVAKVDELMAKIDEMEKTEKSLTDLYNTFPGDMKASLLQAAIQGKLTEQLASDGDAETLYADIQAEKKRLIKEGKIKKEKELELIDLDDVPFDIPGNWKWVRLSDLGANVKIPFADGPFGSNLKSCHYTNKKEVRIIQLSNIGEDGWKDKNTKYTTYEHLKTIERSSVNAGDIVIAKMMPAGRAICVPNIEKSFVLSSDAVKFVPHPLLEKRYILYAINSNCFKSQIYEEVQGITRVRTSLQKLKTYLIPLPPLAEQQRIVEKLDHLLPLCDAMAERINKTE